MVLEVSKSGFYAWDKRPKSTRDKENDTIMEQIKEIHKKNRQTYGSRKITAELRRSGRLVNHKRVVRFMKKAGIRSKLAKKYKATTNSKHNMPVAENILNREFVADRLPLPLQSLGAAVQDITLKVSLAPLPGYPLHMPPNCFNKTPMVV